MRRLALTLLIAVAAAVAALPAFCAEEEPIRVEAVADRTKATVGDRILVTVTVTRPRDVAVLPPAPVLEKGTTLLVEPVAAPEQGKKEEQEEREEPGESVTEIFHFHGQAFETGGTGVPAFRVDWQMAGGKSGSVSTPRIPLEIVSVLTGPGEELADLKPPAEIPPPPFPWKAAGIAALIAALAGAAFILWRRRRRPVSAGPAPPAVPAIPPHELAYSELERLLASHLLHEGKVKEFHVELAEIIKRYLAGRFGIETLERTSEEVLEDLRRARVGTASTGLVREFLAESDLVKFARHFPQESEIRLTVDSAYRLVDQTKLVVAPAPPPGNGASAALPREAAQ